MGKYFKEEETSNRIKRFKTSDIQEKNSRFAQVSKIPKTLSEITKAIGNFDKFLDFLKFPLKGYTRSSNLMKLRPALIEKIESKFIEIAKAHDEYLSPKIKTLKENKDKMAFLSLEQLRASENRKKQITNELADLQAQSLILAKEIPIGQKRAKELIDAELKSFNEDKTLVGGQLTWNGDLANPKLDYIIGMPISTRGTNIALDRLRPDRSENVQPLIEAIFRFGRRTLDSGQLKNIDKMIKNNTSLGFYEKRYTFEDSKNEAEKLNLYEIINRLANGTFKADAKTDPETLKKIQKHFEEFLVELDKLETGLRRNNPLLQSVIMTLPRLVTRGLPTAVVGVVTLPSIITTLDRQRNPNKVRTDVQKAKKRLDIPDIQKDRQKEIDSMPIEMQNFMRELNK
jgi:hypothetical protein